VPHGFLFRGSSEGKKYVHELLRRFSEAVNKLAFNLFFLAQVFPAAMLSLTNRN
jgi:hypothetical protein